MEIRITNSQVHNHNKNNDQTKNRLVPTCNCRHFGLGASNSKF